MKKCPFCAEEIQVEAIVCKHCGRELAPDAVTLVSKGLMQEAAKAPEPEPQRQRPPESAPVSAIGEPKRPVWNTAARTAGVVTALYLVYGIARIALGRIGWEQFAGNLGSAVLIGIITLIVSTIGIWLWRAVTTPLPEEIQATVSQADETDQEIEGAALEPTEEAATELEDQVEEPLTEPAQDELEAPKVYSMPKGLVAAPGPPNAPVWKRAAGVAGAFAALQSAFLIGAIALDSEPEFIGTLSPVQLILSIPAIFGVAFTITALIILGWRYATSQGK